MNQQDTVGLTDVRVALAKQIAAKGTRVPRTLSTALLFVSYATSSFLVSGFLFFHDYYYHFFFL